MRHVNYIFTNIQDQVVHKWEENGRGYWQVRGLVGPDDLKHIVAMPRFLSLSSSHDGFLTFEFDITD